MASQINTFDSLEVWRQKINPYLQMTSNVTKDSIIFQNQTTGSTSTDGFLIGLGGSDGRLWNYENAGVVFGTSAVERMRITGTGNVGIGTSSPSFKLDVSGDLAMSVDAATRVVWNRVGKYLNWIECDGVAGANYMRFAVGNTETLRITQSGYVGIGESAPNQKLSVNGGIRITQSASLGVTNTQTFSYEYPVTRFYVGDGSGYSFAFSKRAASTTTDLVTIQDDTGFVGIGLNSPKSNLHAHASTGNTVVQLTNATGSASTNGMVLIVGSAGESSIYQRENNYLRLGTNNTERLRIDAAGNVGIGTTSPVSNGRTLTVSNSVSGTAALYLQNSGTGATATDGFTLQVDSSSNGYIWNYEAGAVLFGTSASERMRLDSSGRLLIGVASVLGSETLRVYNASNSRVVIDQASGGLMLGSDASGPFIDTTTATRLAVFVGGTERMRIDPTGNLGLGVVPRAWDSTYKAVQLGASAALVGRTGNESVFLGSNFYQDGVGYKYVLAASNYASMYQQASGQHIWSTAAAGTSGNAISFTQAMLLDAAGSLQIKMPAAMGYGTGSGGTVTQATSRTTGVTINKPAGSITLVSAAGSTTWQTFTVTNSTVAVDDSVHVVQRSGTDKYQIYVTNVAAGSFQITFATTGGTTTEQPVFNFSVMKGAIA